MVTFVPRYMWMLSYQNDITQLTTPNSALQLVIDDGGTGYPTGSLGLGWLKMVFYRGASRAKKPF